MPVRSRDEHATEHAKHATLRAVANVVRHSERVHDVSIVEDIDAKLTAGYTFPSRWYWDPAIYRLELDHIWARSWHYVCGTDAIPGGHRLGELSFAGTAGARRGAGGGGHPGAAGGAGLGGAGFFDTPLPGPPPPPPAPPPPAA